MKQIVLTLCILLFLAIVANAACYKCKTSKGTVFTDSPPQDAECELLGQCTNTYSESMEQELKARDAALTKATSLQRQNEAKDKERMLSEIQRRKEQSDSDQRKRDIQSKQNELNSMVKSVTPNKLNDYKKQVSDIAIKKGEIDRLSNQSKPESVRQNDATNNRIRDIEFKQRQLESDREFDKIGKR